MPKKIKGNIRLSGSEFIGIRLRSALGKKRYLKSIQKRVKQNPKKYKSDLNQFKQISSFEKKNKIKFIVRGKGRDKFVDVIRKKR